VTFRILVVDDNPVNRKLACDLLELEGHTTLAAEDASSAMTVLASAPAPDLVLMDIGLPGMDGLELTRRLRASELHATLPIVALTAFAMKGDEEKALAAGCNGYIAKPIDTRRFPSQVMAYLETADAKDSALRVMIIEDHRVDLKLAGEQARLSGHVVLSNTSGEDARATLAQSHPDVVLLDLNLPGIDGLAFLRELKADPATRHLPVVALTAHPDDYRRQELLDAGCAAYLVKPVDMGLLMVALEAAAKALPGA
jgi:two-component system cell cycle response regulator